MSDRLPRAFFARDTLRVARELLGRELVSTCGGERTAGTIVEVEAYIGETDQASHARPGPTERNRAMYGPAGCAYVYFIYGMHHCMNIVTEAEGFPAAVLIRALEPTGGAETMSRRRGGRRGSDLASGPAKLCQALGIDRRMDGADLCSAAPLVWVEAGAALPDASVAWGPRVGVGGDRRAREAPWHIAVRQSPHVSRLGRLVPPVEADYVAG